MTHGNASRPQAGKIYLVTGMVNGREIFLGRAIDEPFQGQISLEGKSMTWTQPGFIATRPFTTIVTFPLNHPNCPIQQINNNAAIEESMNIINSPIAQITRSNFPLIHRWIENGMPIERINMMIGGITGIAPNGFGGENPFSGFFGGFMTSAAQFRRALFQSPQVTSTMELDKLAELEGNLTIEVGKVTNAIAIKLNQISGREPELAQYMEAIQGPTLPVPPSGNLGGWVFLMNRIQIAKNWARRCGKTPLVREINELTKTGINGINELILEHCGTLDTMITDAFKQYGIIYEVHGATSPFASYTAPLAGAIEGPDIMMTPTPTGIRTTQAQPWPVGT